MQQYMYQLKLVRRITETNTWTKEDEAVIREHFMRLKELTEKGIVLLAGKTNRENEDGFGIVIFKATSIEEAKSLMNSDPAVQKGVMTATLFDYMIALESLSQVKSHD